MKIRSLLLLLSLFAAGLTAAEPAPGPVLVCSAYTFRKETLFGAIEKAAQCGVHHIETFTNLPLSPDDPTRIYELSDAQLERLRAHLAKHEVTIVSCMGAVSKDEKRHGLFSLRQKGSVPVTSGPTPWSRSTRSKGLSATTTSPWRSTITRRTRKSRSIATPIRIS